MIDRQAVRNNFRLTLIAEMLINRMSIRRLAKESGVSISAIVSYRNASRDVPLHKVMAMADAMGIEISKLIPKL